MGFFRLFEKGIGTVLASQRRHFLHSTNRRSGVVAPAIAEAPQAGTYPEAMGSSAA
jgi:hypothetical protein